MLWTAFILGFAGSLHCLGMCSPLALTVTRMSPHIVLNRVLYNGGRIFSYGLLGGIAATVGLAFPLMRYQNLLSILLGIALVVIGMAGISSFGGPILSNTLGKASLILKALFSRFLQRKGYRSIFFLGSLNGLLPCGLSFLALTYCVTLSGPADGFNFMALFGLGTLPVMLGFTSAFKWLLDNFNLNIHRTTTVMLVISGVLLIARVFFVHLPEQPTFPDVVDVVICR